MNNYRPPPPPKRTPLSRPMTASSLNDIDGDDDDADDDIDTSKIDEETTIIDDASDVDSILAMARRLDDASAISDPSFIEGVESGQYHHHHHPGGAYARRTIRMDSIASESDNDSSSSSSSDSSDSDSDSSEDEASMGKELNQKRSNGIANSNFARPMVGKPHVGFHESDDTDMELNPNKTNTINNDELWDDELQQRPATMRDGGNRNYRPTTTSSTNYYDGKSRSSSRDRGSSKSTRDTSSHSRGRSQTPRGRSHSPSGISRGGYNNNNNEPGSNGNGGRKKKKKNKKQMKIWLILALIIILIATAVSVSLIITKKKKNPDNSYGSFNNAAGDNTQLISVNLPTSSPTYSGEYYCPLGQPGPVATRGCLGYVACDYFGKGGSVIYCPSNTLYDVDVGICNHYDLVNCLEPQYQSTTTATVPSSTTSTPPTLTFFNPETTTYVPPKYTSGHRLLFTGISNPGNINVLEAELTKYLNYFYTPEHMEMVLDVNDELRSLSDVSITLTITTLERRWMRTRRRSQEDSSSSRFIMVYDQSTSYRTSDMTISIGTIVRRPFDIEYTDELVNQLQEGYPDSFLNLSSIEYLEIGELTSPPTPFTSTADFTTILTEVSSAPTASNINIPTKVPTTKELFTLVPNPSPTTLPVIISEVPTITPPTTLTLTGIVWLDEDQNGMKETTEPPMPNQFVNLRECIDDMWVAINQTDDMGQYYFTNITEGNYYIDYLKPPGGGYNFTEPNVGGDDENVANSDVIKSDDYKGETECLAIKQGFSQLINAGIIIKTTQQEEDKDESDVLPVVNRPQTPLMTSKPITQPTTTTNVGALEFCAFVEKCTTDVFGCINGQLFDFTFCAYPCDNDDCPAGMVCAFTKDCS